jgi:hypothetical protein
MGKSKSYLPFSLLGVFIIVGCIALLFFEYSSEHPKPKWDTSPDNIVISYEIGVGEIDINYIPDFRVWGDGYVVWVENHFDYSRTVFEGYLSQDELKKLIGDFINAGFFSWFEYGGASSSSISIRLFDRNQINALDANDEISQLVHYLQSGAGVERNEFVPTIGYLTLLPIEKTSYKYSDIQPKYSWVDSKFDFSPENFKKIVPDEKITGDKLEFFWKVVNVSPFIEYDEKIYWVGLSIPKISY